MVYLQYLDNETYVLLEVVKVHKTLQTLLVALKLAIAPKKRILILNAFLLNNNIILYE